MKANKKKMQSKSQNKKHIYRVFKKLEIETKSRRKQVNSLAQNIPTPSPFELQLENYTFDGDSTRESSTD